ncbi:hypothetical protein [Butyrivibrio sp. JL13D10]|uniref:hypothetical protein n=1 Tax=Butyrivibrio sp. JL13D10 TaxID=3236815 RepID=UPI0038B5670F
MHKIYGALASIFFWIIVAFLLFISIYNTCLVDEYEVTHFYKGSVSANVLVIVIFFFVLFLLRKVAVVSHFLKKADSDDSFRKKIKVVLFVCLGVLGAAFVIGASSVVASDQIMVQDAAYNVNRGDFSDLMPGGYLFTYPNQLGLLWISILFGKIFGFGNYLAFRLMNVLFFCLFYKRISDVTAIISKNSKRSELAVLIIGVLFVPLLFYCSFIYGTIPGLALSTSAVYHSLIFSENKRVKNAIMASLLIALSMLFKSNYLIVFIAILIHSLVSAIDCKKKVLLILPVLLIVGYLLQSFVPAALTKYCTGMDAPKGASSLSWIAMGLQDSGLAEGWYNGYNKDTFENSGYDSEVQAEQAKENIKGRVEYFKNNKFECFRFFSRKLSSEWNDPTFEGYWINREDADGAGHTGLAAYLLSDGVYRVWLVILDNLQAIILFGAYIYAVLKENKESDLVIAIAFIGGFLFHTFWEAKPQYTLTYFVLLFPLCVIGYKELLEFADSVFAANINKRPGIAKSVRLILIFAIPLVIFYLMYSGSVGASLIEESF